MLAIAAFFHGIWKAAGRAWRAIAASKPLTYLLAGTLALLAIVFGVKRAMAKARKAGADEREEKIFDRIERDTKHAIEKIEKAERDLSQEIGPEPRYEDTGDGRGLTTDDYNTRQLERLRQRAEADSRNRGNPRSDPRG